MLYPLSYMPLFSEYSTSLNTYDLSSSVCLPWQHLPIALG